MKEKLGNIFKNYGFYLFPIIAIVAIITLFVKIDLPKIGEIGGVRQQLSGIQERLAKLSAKSQFLASLDEEKLKGDYEKTSLVLPDGKDAPSILRTLEISASVSGIFLENLDLTPGKLATAGARIGEKQNEIPLKVTISGTTPQITTYLEKITSVGRALGIKNLEISFSEGTVSAKVNLELVAYYLFPPQSTGKVEESLPSLGTEENDTLSEINQRELTIPQPILSPAGKTDLFK
ncbi:type 4a pilus biogenesis protein PilO [Candidatus Gottesmanbacteria bacterium]|nr:type 4a pilus biogenesis protein PilO [Candidatus Gottesmanbacteria bacterium]